MQENMLLSRMQEHMLLHSRQSSTQSDINQVSQYVKILSITVFFSLNFSFLDIYLFLKKFCSMKYVLLEFFLSFL